MKVVALISGGKDSLYSLCKCIAYGHEVVALGNLFPEDSNVHDADSYMYQTVGHEIIQAYAKALLLPLFRRPTKGKAVLTTLGYSRQPYDEVEDLYQLLLQVKQEMPQVEAVCSGAILSDYQRNRVEHVCSRLQLTSIAYLWRRNQKELLQEISQVGIDAIVVKVAAMGLYPRKHLGKHLVELAPVLMELESKYGTHVCGEGGEFESLVLDCPLFYYRLVIDEAEKVIVSDDRFAPIGYLRIQKYHLEEKSLHVNRTDWIKTIVPIKSMSVQTRQREARKSLQKDTSWMYSCQSRWCVSKTTNISYFLCCHKDSHENRKNIVEEMKNILEELEESLKECSLTRKDIFYCQLYLSDMSQFALVNQVYASYFGAEEPPSRACIEVSLCLHQPIVLEAFARKGPRKVLHVQSISEWAPPCIGSYSQAQFFQYVVFISGILPLHPPTVTIVSGMDIEQETMLCIENVNHTMEALPCGLEDILFIYCYITQPQAEQRVATLLYNAYGKQLGLCILPIRSLPRNGSIELQVICALSNDVTGNSLQDDSHPICNKQVLQGEFPMFLLPQDRMTMKSTYGVSDDDFQVMWQLCTSGSLIVLHATWKQVPFMDMFKKVVTAILHQWIRQWEKHLDPIGAHVAWSPLVCKSWLPKDLFHGNSNCHLQDIIEEILVKVLSNEHSMNRTPAFIIPLEQDEQVRTCHLHLILQLDEKVTQSRL
ncbi:hypothetical protein GpartN1_g5174.t1 [Galdieria partita]|uniref:Diphthine--ammonia ligase n=1 Tax=Galdieria partita TaxID=83374 RepID=A0A9C7PYZ7_9RHOD|nr:hypothetical protein GpartN1_g5174.t1 [Galdieria partita]